MHHLGDFEGAGSRRRLRGGFVGFSLLYRGLLVPLSLLFREARHFRAVAWLVPRIASAIR